ncbi:hypothetical protein [Nocardiopsis composta]|uniref:Transposase n=1 Tax=Nocardiopsis composta TaxID=157465 RepID=A0A7W8VC73_9ACTN|nr:hypothetical protein [Nocardiopsis composta]MBB5431141.1 hypothetical protein [Nocardiopsis composta]
MRQIAQDQMSAGDRLTAEKRELEERVRRLERRVALLSTAVERLMSRMPHGVPTPAEPGEV